jgi:hypothetical protein
LQKREVILDHLPVPIRKGKGIGLSQFVVFKFGVSG